MSKDASDSNHSVNSSENSNDGDNTPFSELWYAINHRKAAKFCYDEIDNKSRHNDYISSSSSGGCGSNVDGVIDDTSLIIYTRSAGGILTVDSEPVKMRQMNQTPESDMSDCSTQSSRRGRAIKGLARSEYGQTQWFNSSDPSRSTVRL